ncbi:MAG: lipoyl synthase [Candidatus Schekmanbacteria bacterium]|nr:lipoyl synthase [Candidatus Schekmanbacteria bacterium]
MPRKPDWLKVQLPGAGAYANVKTLLHRGRLHTVCEEARCPNLGECWGGGTATFMLLGDVCTRGCRFCAVKSGHPSGVDAGEPESVATASRELRLTYVVLTSVDRDDLSDGGAAHFAATVAALRNLQPAPRIEVLVPDFQGNRDDLRTVVASDPDVLAHNVETVARLTPSVRDRRAGYARSLAVLAAAKELGAAVTKSSLMLGLGETDAEIRETLAALRQVGTDIVTLGQYLKPSPRHLDVVEYVHPARFLRLRDVARDLGFSQVAAGPRVRSSYRAGELFEEHVGCGAAGTNRSPSPGLRGVDTAERFSGSMMSL